MPNVYWYMTCGYVFHRFGAPVPVAHLVEPCDLKVAGSNPGLKGPSRTISIFSAPYAVPVFRTRHQIETRVNCLTVPSC